MTSRALKDADAALALAEKRCDELQRQIAHERELSRIERNNASVTQTKLETWQDAFRVLARESSRPLLG